MIDNIIRKPKLPDLCFSVLESTGELVVIKNGEQGYHPSLWSTADPVHNRETADFNNQRLGVTPIQVKAMVNGSMFGWDKPLADPDFLATMDARIKKSLNETIADANSRTTEKTQAQEHTVGKER